MCFFHLNFLNAQGILAQSTFCLFSDVINGEQSQQPSVLSQLATFLTVFLAFGLHKFNYIKNDFV